MDWASGYTAKYYMTEVDWETMSDYKRVEITGGSIKRSLTNLRASADIDCVNYDDNAKEQIIRIWLDAKQEGSSSHEPLFTGISACPRDKYTGRRKSNSLECYSMLKIADDVLLPRGWYAPVDANSSTVLTNLLSVVKVPIHFPANIEAPNLKQAIIAEQGETNLSMSEKVLDAMGKWRMRVDGYGDIWVEPLPTESIVTFDSLSNDVIETDIEVCYDWYSAPNVLRCTLDGSFAEARDEDDLSPLSIQNRGREVWMEDTNVNLSTDETLGEYALRMLKYYQQRATSVSYARRFNPDVSPSDIVGINYPEQNIQGTFLVTDQTITLGYNARTSEEVVKI